MTWTVLSAFPRAAREKGILTVGIVTKPFMFEGSRRMKLAEQGIENLYEAVDTMITIPNQNLFRVAVPRQFRPYLPAAR